MVSSVSEPAAEPRRVLVIGRDGAALQPVIISAVSAVACIVLLQMPGIFPSGRRPLIYITIGILLLACAIAGIVRRIDNRGFRSFTLIGVFTQMAVGTSTTNVTVIICCVVATGAIVCTAAIMLRGWEVGAVAFLSSTANSIMMALTRQTTLNLIVTIPTAAAIACTPGLLLLKYRYDLERALKVADSLAVRDQLTGLLNRHGLDQGAGPMVARAARQRELLGVLIIDIDHFKDVNDTHGHGVGDRVICRVGEALSGFVRAGDLVVRLGGEEFCLVLTLADPDELTEIAQRIRRAIAASRETPPVTVSVGGTHTRPGGTDDGDLVYRLITESDLLLYAAKAAGRDAVRISADALS